MAATTDADPWSTENVDWMARDGTACTPQPGMPEYEGGTEEQRAGWDASMVKHQSAPVRHRRPKRHQRVKVMSDPMRKYLEEKRDLYVKNVARATVEMEKFQAEAQARLNDIGMQRKGMEDEIVKLNELLAPPKTEEKCETKPALAAVPPTNGAENRLPAEETV